MVDLGVQSLISILSHLLFISITWWALQAIHYEKWMKPNRVVQMRLLLILVTIAIGSAVSNFFLDYLFLSQRLPMMW
ncbi:putative integral membrane protein (TIGR02327 family) [Bacillus tianshenii]|uniref:Integral membrane protein (TIGR02327 family) n=1 Tax=Sutcliffiella tianshenii TaxID=1463404 RepID=A0ABS2NVF3_9BACI|nr:DUF1146 family protein [Bacillus tianshenii]MBM7618621.1 putative integral membrane protein (TIGR02327 family) [Bacillus tianshenii]MCA1320266.1 DUF1146 family protein [Bacillus tianshenii]